MHRTHSRFISCNTCVRLRLSFIVLSLTMALFTFSSHSNDGHNSMSASISLPLSVDALFMILSHNSWHSSDNNAFDLSVRWPTRKKFRNNVLAMGCVTTIDAGIIANRSIWSKRNGVQPQKHRNTRWSTGDGLVWRIFCTCSDLSSFGRDSWWRCVSLCWLPLLWPLLLLFPSPRWDIFQFKNRSPEFRWLNHAFTQTRANTNARQWWVLCRRINKLDFNPNVYSSTSSLRSFMYYVSVLMNRFAVFSLFPHGTN